MVHGDFHPANLMIKCNENEIEDIKIVDWEMVGVGNGSFELC